jgi:hypothetical protein
MRRLLSSLFAALIVFSVSPAQAQFVQTGWRIASEIKAAEDLIGAWEVIAVTTRQRRQAESFCRRSHGFRQNFLNTQPWTAYYYENTSDNTYEKRWSFQATVKNNTSLPDPIPRSRSGMLIRIIYPSFILTHRQM